MPLFNKPHDRRYNEPERVSDTLPESTSVLNSTLQQNRAGKSTPIVDRCIGNGESNMSALNCRQIAQTNEEPRWRSPPAIDHYARHDVERDAAPLKAQTLSDRFGTPSLQSYRSLAPMAPIGTHEMESEKRSVQKERSVANFDDLLMGDGILSVFDNDDDADLDLKSVANLLQTTIWSSVGSAESHLRLVQERKRDVCERIVLILDERETEEFRRLMRLKNDLVANESKVREWLRQGLLGYFSDLS